MTVLMFIVAYLVMGFLAQLLFRFGQKKYNFPNKYEVDDEDYSIIFFFWPMWILAFAFMLLAVLGNKLGKLSLEIVEGLLENTKEK